MKVIERKLSDGSEVYELCAKHSKITNHTRPESSAKETGRITLNREMT